MACAAVIPVFLAACLSEPPGQTAPFERVGSYLTGAHPVAGVIVDVDGDGDEDLIAPALVTNDVVVIENDSSELAWHQVGPLTVGAGDAISADVLGEGRSQLVTSNRDLDRIDIYSITGAPGLEHLETIQVSGATGLAATDVDGDGDTDLIVSRFRDASLEVFIQESGALVRDEIIETSAGPFIICAADIDGDAADELIVAAATADTIDVFVRTDSGWQRRGAFETSRWPSSLLVGKSSAESTVVFGTSTVGDEVFQITIDKSLPEWSGTYLTLASADGPFAIAKTEVNGAAALAVTNKDESTVSLFTGFEEGEPPVEESRFETGHASGPSPLFSWDYNSDGRADLAIINAFTDEVVIFRGR